LHYFADLEFPFLLGIGRRSYDLVPVTILESIDWSPAVDCFADEPYQDFRVTHLSVQTA
jgi:hypothetical protein